MPSQKGPPELKHLAHILVTPSAIKRRIAALGQQLNKDYAKKDLMVVAIVNGALIFTADLLRQMRSPLRLDCLRASSYHDGTKAVHEPRIFDSMKLDVRGHNVLLVDDILDTGRAARDRGRPDQGQGRTVREDLRLAGQKGPPRRAFRGGLRRF